MRTGKKWLLFLGVTAMILAASFAIAESSGNCGPNVTWSLSDSGVLTISGQGAMRNYESQSTYGGTVAPWRNLTVTGVVIEDGVTGIGDYAFYNKSDIESIQIQDSVTLIGKSAFCGCSSLAEINIPNKVTSIGDYVFCRCSQLESIVLPDGITTIPNNAFVECSALASVQMSNDVTSIGQYAFYKCSSLDNFTIPDGVTSIGDEAFRECSSLASITFADQITSWGSKLTYYGTQITDITIRVISGKGYSAVPYSFSSYIKAADVHTVIIPSGVTGIANSAFSECSGITSITIPDSVLSIGNGAFSKCTSLENVFFPDSVASGEIGTEAFSNCTSLKSISIPYGITSIGDSAFYWCESLKSISIPDSVTNIGERAFSLSGLESIIIPDNITAIGRYAFPSVFTIIYTHRGSNAAELVSKRGYSFRDPNLNFSLRYIYADDVYTGTALTGADTSIVEIVVPDYVTEISAGAFSGCTELENVVIHSGISSIGNNTFYQCESLSSISMTNSITSIGDRAFYGCSSLEEIEIPDQVTSIGSSAFYGCSSLENLEIPDQVTSIGDSAFYGCSSLKSINIPDGVENINTRVFCGCQSVENIVIPKNVKSIGQEAFYGCNGLVSITIPDGVTNINYSSFSGCPAIRYASINSEGAKALGKAGYSFRTADSNVNIKYNFSGNEITDLGVTGLADNATEANIPAGVQSIRDYAFRGCESLTSVFIPGSVTKIGLSAFSGCTALASIEIPENVTHIESGAFNLCYAIRYAKIGTQGAKALCNAGYNFTVKGYENVRLKYNQTDDSDLILESVNRNATNAAIPTGVTSIKNDALTGCSKLKGIIIPEGVRTIGLPNSTTTSYPDRTLDALEGAVIPDSVTAINTEIFGRNTVIYCNEYSVAENWANEHGHRVVLLDSTEGFIEPAIEISDEFTLILGRTYEDLEASVFPYTKETVITYTSANTRIVRIGENGEIIPVTTGETTVTVSANGISKTTHVSVIQLASGFTIPSDIYVVAKGTTDVTVTSIVPQSATMDLIWRIGDTSFASVDQNGRITGKAIGDTTLTVTDQLTELTVTAPVHVTRPVSKVEFAEKEVSVRQKATVQLRAAVYTGAQQSMDNILVTFTSSDPEIASVNGEGVVTGINPGTVTVTASSDNGFSDDCTVHVIYVPILTMPSGTRTIEESAFEGVTTVKVVYAQNCRAIGKWAFKGCTGLEQIWLPKNCNIHDLAFEGCGTVTVFAPAGGTTQAYCDDPAHIHCVFATEATSGQE